MKILFFILAAIATCGACFAQSYDRATLSFTSVTNAAALTNALAPNIRGELAALAFTFTGNPAPTVSVSVVKSASLSGPAETISATTARTADATVRPMAFASTNGVATATWLLPYTFTGDAALTVISTNQCLAPVTVRIDAIYKR